MLGDIAKAEDIYIVCGYSDMRKSIDGFAAIIKGSNEVNNDNSVTINEYNGLNQLVKVRKEAILSVIPTIGMG